jgi:hypothetical protein
MYSGNLDGFGYDQLLNGMLNGYGTHLAPAFWMNALQLFALQQNATLYENKNSKEISYGPAQKQFN